MSDAVERFSISADAVAAAMEIVGGQLPMQEGNTKTGELDDSGLAWRCRRWFIEAMSHPMWKRYMKEAEEDEGFYIGGELQWSYEGSQEDLNRLKASNRTVISLNHIAPLVDVLVGFERQNQYDLKALPMGQQDSDAVDAQIMSWLLKFHQDQTECQETQSEIFHDGIVRGAGCAEIAIDWSEDPIDGVIKVNKLKPGKNCLWDPYWEKYDFSDARFFIKYKFAYLEDLLALYPEKEVEILAAVTSLEAHLGASMTDSLTTQGRPEDPYGRTNASHLETSANELEFYDPLGRRILVLEAWYRTNERLYVAANKVTGETRTSERRAELEGLVTADPERWRIVERNRRRMNMGVILPATLQTLEKGVSPYENDKENYPFAGYVAKKFGDHMYGLVRNLKDPQRIENKKMSNALDIAQRFGNMRAIAAMGSLDDPRTLEDSADNSTIFYDPKKGPPPTYLVPPLEQAIRPLTELGTLLGENAVKTVSGVNADLLGQKADDTSGIAIARRQAQGQTIATIYFDNLKRTRKIIGQRLARRIQQVMPTDKVIRLTDTKTGEPRIVTINPRDAKDLKGDAYTAWLAKQKDEHRPYILRDIQSLKYDITISDAPSTPNARSTALLALLEIGRTAPQLVPLMLDFMVQLADIPDRHELLARVRQSMHLDQDGNPLPPPPMPPPQPKVSINLKGEIDPDVAKAAAAGQPIQPGPAGPTPTAVAAQQKTKDRAAKAATTMAGKLGQATLPGQPSVSAGMAPETPGVPVPTGVAKNPASTQNPKVMPTIAQKALGNQTTLTP
jgi:hypothetical protein